MGDNIAALQTAQKILAKLYDSQLNNATSAVKSVGVDGTEVVYQSSDELQQAILFWERRVAILRGSRRRASSIRLDGF